MMWILIETNTKGTQKKFMGAKNYDTLIKYINTFMNIRKIDDYHFDSEQKEFVIQMCELLDWRDYKDDKHKKSEKIWNLQTKKSGHGTLPRCKKTS